MRLRMIWIIMQIQESVIRQSRRLMRISPFEGGLSSKDVWNFPPFSFRTTELTQARPQGFSAAVPFSGDSLYHWCRVITEFCKRLLNLVDAGWLRRISWRISANKRRRNFLNFLNTNLTKSAAIWLKNGQSLKITHAKEKERRKRKSEEEERRRRREKSNGCTLSCYHGYFGGNVLENPARYI